MAKENQKNTIEVPVVVATTSPFTIISFNKKDQLKPTLDQINHNTYDRLKLCRTTTVAKTEIDSLIEKNMGVVVGYTTSLLFPRMEGISRFVARDATNKILLSLFFGGIIFDAVSPDDIGYGKIYGSGYYTLTGGSTGPNYAFLHSLQQQTTNSFESIKINGC